MTDHRRNRKKRKNRHTLFWIIFLELFVVTVGLAIILFTRAKNQIGSLPRTEDTELTLEYEDITEAETQTVHVVPKPDIQEQLLTVNDWSRPGKKIKSLDYIVIHYLGNPMTTAQQNHDYFESLKDLQNASMSANYVVGMEGEIIHCVPDDEVAYASNQANSYSISVENCHPDESGKFTGDTYDSLVKLVAYLTDQYGLERDQIIRHYDVTGKDCPKYFVEHEDAWEQFKDDVMVYRSQCEEEAKASAQQKTEDNNEDDELAKFLAENAGDAAN